MKSSLQVLLCAPRGFCAGVDRAIQIVELALAKFGPPVYVRHEIVHNKYVVDGLRDKGAVFVETLDEIPEADKEAPVIFSAHGVPKSVPEAATARQMFWLDATCPLVSKVHVEAQRHFKQGLEIVLIGHKGHPEVIGTMGQLPDGVVKLVETTEDARLFEPQDSNKISYVTQTTLSVDDTAEIVEILRKRFPKIVGPHKEDLCYATTNRQVAVKEIGARCDAVLVVGAPNSSNSMRLVDVAVRAGCPKAFLVQTADDIPWQEMGDIGSIGITAGASAPEILVEQVIDALASRYDISVETVTTAEENIEFNVPRELRDVKLPASAGA